MKVLVTGFEPFGGATINPALEAVRRLPAKIAGADVVTVQIPVVSEKDAAAVDALTRTFSDPGWLYGRDASAGQTVRRARFGWGGVTLRYALAQGRLREVALASDGLEADYLAGVPARLEGCAATPAAVEAALTRDTDPGLRAIAADLAGLLFALPREEVSA